MINKGGFNRIVNRNTPVRLDEKRGSGNKVSKTNIPFFASVTSIDGSGLLEFSSTDGRFVGSAKSLFPNVSSPPLKGEMILIFPCPNSFYNNPQGGNIFNAPVLYFYVGAINFWSNPRFNGIAPPSTSDSYFQNEVSIPLSPNKGDVIFEGRFNNSIRLGNTSEGFPLTIICNGRKGMDEDIKLDQSCIYLTSKQTLPNFSLINENFYSYKNQPSTPSTYSNPQLVLSSGRISLNAKQDDIFLSAQNSVGILSNNTVNIESINGTTIFGKVNLGSTTPTEPALLGNKTVTLLRMLITEVRNISLALEANEVFPKGAVAADGSSISIAGSAVDICNSLLSQLNPKTGKPKILSNKVKISE